MHSIRIQSQSFELFSANFDVRNLQLSVGKLQLPSCHPNLF